MQTLGEHRPLNWSLFYLGGLEDAGEDEQATSWWEYSEPAGDDLHHSVENQEHSMVSCTCCFSAWFMPFLVQTVPHCNRVSGLSMSKPFSTYCPVWIFVEVLTKRLFYLLFVLSLAWFCFTSWSHYYLYWHDQEGCRAVGWGSGDVYLCLLLKRMYVTQHLAVAYILIRKIVLTMHKLLWSNIQLHSVGAGTFIFMFLLRHKVTVWHFLPACKASEEALRRNG